MGGLNPPPRQIGPWFERNLTQPEPCVRLYPLLPDISTQLVLPETATPPLQNPTYFSAVGRCENTSHLDRGYQIRFRLGLRYEEAYSAPQT